MVKLPDEFVKLLNEMEQDRLKAVRAKAIADPKGNKLTTVMTGGRLTHRAWGGGVTRNGDQICFCVADHVNVAGYVLAWREVWYKKPRKTKHGRITMKRDQWTAKKSYYAAVKLTEARAERSRARYKR